jgi:hypothetical protein
MRGDSILPAAPGEEAVGECSPLCHFAQYYDTLSHAFLDRVFD